MKKNSKPTKFLSAKTKVIKQKEDNMEVTKNLRGLWIKICGEMSSQGFLCCSLVLWHACLLQFQLHQVCFWSAS